MATTDTLADLRSQHQSLQDSLASGFLTDDDRRTVYQGMIELSERIAALEGALKNEEGR